MLVVSVVSVEQQAGSHHPTKVSPKAEGSDDDADCSHLASVVETGAAMHAEDYAMEAVDAQAPDSCVPAAAEERTAAAGLLREEEAARANDFPHEHWAAAHHGETEAEHNYARDHTAEE